MEVLYADNELYAVNFTLFSKDPQLGYHIEQARLTDYNLCTFSGRREVFDDMNRIDLSDYYSLHREVNRRTEILDISAHQLRAMPPKGGYAKIFLDLNLLQKLDCHELSSLKLVLHPSAKAEFRGHHL